MKLYIYSVRDVKADIFNRPFYENNDAMAMRTLHQSSIGTLLEKYPEDFLLYKIGVFDDATGDMIPEETAIQIGRVDQIIEMFNKVDKQ